MLGLANPPRHNTSLHHTTAQQPLATPGPCTALIHLARPPLRLALPMLWHTWLCPAKPSRQTTAPSLTGTKQWIATLNPTIALPYFTPTRLYSTKRSRSETLDSLTIAKQSRTSLHRDVTMRCANKTTPHRSRAKPCLASTLRDLRLLSLAQPKRHRTSPYLAWLRYAQTEQRVTLLCFTSPLLDGALPSRHFAQLNPTETARDTTVLYQCSAKPPITQTPRYLTNAQHSRTRLGCTTAVPNAPNTSHCRALPLQYYAMLCSAQLCRYAAASADSLASCFLDLPRSAFCSDTMAYSYRPYPPDLHWPVPFITPKSRHVFIRSKLISYQGLFLSVDSSKVTVNPHSVPALQYSLRASATRSPCIVVARRGRWSVPSGCVRFFPSRHR